MNLKLIPVIVAAGVLLAGTEPASAQSSDALLNKLVEKGILTTDEAKQLKTETDKNFTTAYATKAGMPEWVTGFKFGGDFRGRFDEIVPANEAALNRSRWRYRARFGFVATLWDDVEVGIRLTSGDLDSGVTVGSSPLSVNQTFQNNASKKGVFLDLAYAKWSPLHTADWHGSLTFGKMAAPFVFSEVGLGLDPDYTPEGAAFNLEYKLNDSQTLRWNNGAFVVDEAATSSDDPFFYGTQLRLDSKWSPRVSSSAGVLFLGFANVDQLSNGSIPNMNVGNTRSLPTGVNPATAIPLYNFNPILADASVTYQFDHAPLYPGKFPVKLVGSYLNNPAADTGNYGWSGGIVFGKAGKQGTWELSYCYKWLGANALFEEVADDDLGAYWASTTGLDFGTGNTPGYYSGTNVRGSITKFSYSPADFLTLSLKWYLTALIDEPDVAAGVEVDSIVNRFQVDALFKF